jgi:alginate biosynthesis protein AlgK
LLFVGYRKHHKTLWALAFVGAGLARDADTSIYQPDRGDAIAGKPAPTFSLRSVSGVVFCCSLA